MTGRFAMPWSTRAQSSCFGFICGLARTASASDEVSEWVKRVSGTTTEMVESIDPISTLVANAGAGGAVAEMMLVWRVAMSSCSVWSQQTRPSAGGRSRAPESGKSRRVCVRSIGVCSVRTDG